MTKEEQLMDEWKEIRETLRYFGNKRFAQLTVFLAVNGFAIDAFFKQEHEVLKYALIALGLVTALLFGAMEHRSNAFYTLLAARAPVIETALGGHLKLATHHRSSAILKQTDAAAFGFYCATAVLWLALIPLNHLIKQDAKGAAWAVGIALKQAPALVARPASQWTVERLASDSAVQSFTVLLAEVNGTTLVTLVIDEKTGAVKSFSRK
ncbi:MAG: hypothetical protein JWP96_2444 [Polaromonas sp.]|jgi:hypothetical protein|nr:hypothetical protein [Polaromonas sp.]